VSRQSLLADLANLRGHNERLRRQVNKLARRLSDALGEEVFRASGLGGPDDTEQLRRRVSELEQTMMDLRQQLEERTEELDAARTTNRDLMAEVNRLPGRWDTADTAPSRKPRR
jgi:chromosome segregation ATPase